MGFNAADLIVIAVLLVSGGLAMMRGFVREVLGVIGWIGAVFATLYLLPFAEPYARQLITIEWVAEAAAGIAIFLISLILLSMVSGAISSRIRNSGFNPLDRSLGFVYGLARGAVLVCLVYFLWVSVFKAEDPEVIATAKLLPAVQQGAELIRRVIPSGAIEAADRTKQKTEKALEAERALHELTAPEPKGDAPRDAPAYDQKGLDRLIERSQ
jgi:membrane protein required for colicin V production